MKNTKDGRSLTNKLLIAAIVVALVAIAMSSYVMIYPPVKIVTVYGGLPPVNITGPLILPQSSYSDSPVITQNQSFGSRLTDINAPLSATELSAINNAPAADFVSAGEMYLNGTIKNLVGTTLPGFAPTKLAQFNLNGKPVVIYLGSTTCIYCAENRWAMALALSRFGNFSQLFKGYSALGDRDVPTLYWAPTHYDTSSTVLGSFFNSSYISFLSIEDGDPIRGGFNLSSLSTMQKRINQTNNTAYKSAMQYIIASRGFGGTPYSVWGTYQIGGVDAAVFGNSSTDPGIPIMNMTHADILSQLSNPADQFAWSEYAAADVYVAMVCKTLGNSTQASICNQPVIKSIESQIGL